MSNRISMNFKTKVKAREFNELLAGVVQPGVYENGDAALAKSASPGKVVVKAGTRLYIYSEADVDEGLGLSPICVNVVVSADSSDIAVTQSTPYICASFTWQDNTDVANLGVSYTAKSRTDAINPANNYVIIGQALYDATYTLLDKFDYSEQTKATTAQTYTEEFKASVHSILDGGNFLKNKVYIHSGKAVINKVPISWTGGYITLTYGLTTTGQERKDLIVMDSTGTLSQITGTVVISPLVPAAPAVPNDKLVLAVIHRKYDQGDVVYPEDITRVDQARTNLVYTTDKSVYDFFPVGSVIMFDGSWTDNVTIPGWYACTGQSTPGGTTPNLVGKFIRGGSTAGATGGADSVTLATTNLPSHAHAITDPGHNHSLSVSGTTSSNKHSHWMFLHATGTADLNYQDPNLPTTRKDNGSGWNYQMATSAGLSGGLAGKTVSESHTHTVTSTGTSGGNYTGISLGTGTGCDSTAFSILPSYYTMIYIKKMVAYT